MRRTIETIGTDWPRQCEIVASPSDMEIDTTTPARMFQSIIGRLPSSGEQVDLLVSDKIEKELPSYYRPATDSDPARIEVDQQTLGDPLRTVVELSNQYATHYWQTSERIDPGQVHANLTHLLPICCGLGILASDASFYDVQWSQAGWQGWSMSRSGYYNASEIGYASALLARHRGERAPRWIQSMRLDSRDAAKKAFRYFDDCDRHNRPLLFDAVSIPSSKASTAELSGWFAGEDESFALAAGYALVQMDRPSPLAIESAILAARGSNSDLVPIAIELLGRSRPPTDEVRLLVDKLVVSSNQQVSVASLVAAESLGMPVISYKKRISYLLEVYAEGSDQLIELIARSGDDFESFDRVVCQHLTEAIRYSNDGATTAILSCLKRISTDPRAVIEKTIGEDELKERALLHLDGNGSSNSLRGRAVSLPPPRSGGGRTR